MKSARQVCHPTALLIPWRYHHPSPLRDFTESKLARKLRTRDAVSSVVADLRLGSDAGERGAKSAMMPRQIGEKTDRPSSRDVQGLLLLGGGRASLGIVQRASSADMLRAAVPQGAVIDICQATSKTFKPRQIGRRSAGPSITKSRVARPPARPTTARAATEGRRPGRPDVLSVVSPHHHAIIAICCVVVPVSGPLAGGQHPRRGLKGF